MRKLGLMLLAGTMLSAGVVRAEEDCKTAPDCTKLGYTMDASVCGGAALYCPWDLSKASCREKSPLPILYGDGSVSNVIKSNPKPIGVVFDEGRKLAIALTDIGWKGKPESTTILMATADPVLIALPCAQDKLETCGVDGRENTDILLRISRPGTPIAPHATNLYEPEGCIAPFCKKNKWFIPSARDLLNVRKKFADIKNTLKMLADAGGTKLADHYWSSTQGEMKYGDSQIYGFYLSSEKESLLGLANGIYLRPVVYYGDEIKKTDFSIPCVVGALLGGDGKCYTTKLNSGVSAIGVVFDTEKRLAAALTDVKKDGTAGAQKMKWSTGRVIISGVSGYCKEDAENCGPDGRANTTKMLKATSGGTYEAAQAVNKYEPAGCAAPFCRKTNWFLPSYREFKSLQGTTFGHADMLHNALKLIPGLSVSELQLHSTFSGLGYQYWTSSEFNADKGFAAVGSILNWNKDRNFYVRPVVKY